MTPAQVEKELNAAKARYWAEVDRIANAVRRENVAPFCHKHGVKFVAGMGGWSFHGKAAIPGWFSGIWREDKLPATLSRCMRAETITGQNLGSLIPDYTPDNYKPD